MTQERDFIIDQIKGFGMILVILGHMSVGQELHQWIYSFHMPLFAFVSAVFLKNNYKSGGVMKKARRLILPFVAFSVISWLGYTLLTACYYPEHLPEQLKKIAYVLAGSGQNACPIWGNGNVTLWFLPFLFLSILAYWLGRFLHLKFLDVVCSVILAYVCAAYGIKLPANLDTVFLLYPFIRLGAYYVKLRLLVYKMPVCVRIILCLILFVIHFFLCRLNGRVDTASNVFGNHLILFYMTAVCGIVGVVLLFHIYNRHCSSIEYVGRNSIVYLITNIPILQLFNYFCKDGMQSVLWELPFVLLAIVPIAYVLTNYFPCLLGMKRVSS